MKKPSPNLTFKRPWMYPAQERAIYTDTRYALIEASTKAGKTVGCLVWLLEQAVKGRTGEAYWWVAPVYSQAEIAYRRMKLMCPKKLCKPNDTKLTLTLCNGAQLVFKSGEKSDNLFGEDVYACVIDEASRVRKESWHAVRSTLSATAGLIRMIGNVRGRSNWFYQLCRKAESGEPGYSYSMLTAWDAVDAGVLQREEVEDAKRALPEHVYEELYQCQPSDTGQNPFGIQSIQSCVVGGLSKHQPWVWGIDLAKSIDWTVAIALDRSGRVCRFERWQGNWDSTIEKLVRLIGNTQALVDSTGVGNPITELLQHHVPVEPFVFTNTSKQQIMEGLAVALQQGWVKYPSGPIVSELECYEYEYNSTGRVRYVSSAHDDCVCSLALAVELGRRCGLGIAKPARRSRPEQRRTKQNRLNTVRAYQ